MAYRGGETAARARLQGWAFDRGCLKDYFETRNGLVGADYSTKLAPWLALGCISARRVFSEVKRYEASPTGVANKSTYWVVFELLWRDFFKFMGAKVGTKLFERTGPVPPTGPGAQSWRDPRRDAAAQVALRAWQDGQTGVPFVDASMRELHATGFMSNRGRQNVASFLIHDLQLDWRSGADHFEAMLLDYDATSNWGNWVAAAGLTGGRVNRFNMLKQARDYDPDAAFVHLWCPELKSVPAPLAFEPWKLSAAQQASDEVKAYPARIPTPGSAEAFFGQGGGGSGGGKGGGKGGGGPVKAKAKADDRPGRGKRGGRVQSSYMDDYE
jgi:deoxyribodipyrimidine photo-lyase